MLKFAMNIRLLSLKMSIIPQKSVVDISRPSIAILISRERFTCFNLEHSLVFTILTWLKEHSSTIAAPFGNVSIFKCPGGMLTTLLLMCFI